MMQPELHIKLCPVCASCLVHSTRSGVGYRRKQWTDGQLHGVMWIHIDKLILCPHCRNAIWVDNLIHVRKVSTQESLWRTAQPKRITLVYDTSEYVNTTENTVSTPTESSLEKLLHFVVALAETCALFILVIMKLIENIYLDIWPKKQCEVIKNQEFLAAMRRSAYSADYTRMSQCKQLTFTDYMRYIRTAKIDENKQFYVRQRAWWYANDKRRKDPTLPLTRPEIKNLRALMLLIDETDEEQRITKGEILRELGKFDEARACLESVDNPNLQTVVTFLMNCVKARDTTLHIIK